MKLEHGKSYITDNSEVVTVTERTDAPHNFPFVGDNGRWYMEDGSITAAGECIHDIVGPAISLT